MVGGVLVSHEFHNTMPLSAVITRVQRNLLRVRTILFGVRLLHECTLARLLDAKCIWTKLKVIRVEVKLIVVESLELS